MIQLEQMQRWKTTASIMEDFETIVNSFQPLIRIKTAIYMDSRFVPDMFPNSNRLYKVYTKLVLGGK